MSRVVDVGFFSLNVISVRFLRAESRGPIERTDGRPDLRRANCAGQGCEEREGCKRYRVRALAPRVEREDEKSAPWTWVSADVERGLLGSCALRVEFDARRYARRA